MTETCFSLWLCISFSKCVLFFTCLGMCRTAWTETIIFTTQRKSTSFITSVEIFSRFFLQAISWKDFPKTLLCSDSVQVLRTSRRDICTHQITDVKQYVVDFMTQCQQPGLIAAGSVFHERKISGRMISCGQSKLGHLLRSSEPGQQIQIFATPPFPHTAPESSSSSGPVFQNHSLDLYDSLSHQHSRVLAN